MDFRVHGTKDFEGSCYMEVGPGRWSGGHWQPGFLFIDEDDFVVAEGIIGKHFPEFDHYGMNDIPEAVALSIVEDWRDAARALASHKTAVSAVLHLGQGNEYREGRLEADRARIAAMISDLAEACDAFTKEASGFCVLGL
jgi:hypothetical protein